MKNWSLFFKFLTFAVLIIGLVHTSPASACRDCPFPMMISAGRWMMPSGLSVLTVDEVSIGKSRMESTIRLVDASSGEILAQGMVAHGVGRKHIKAELVDSHGGSMEIELFFQDIERKKLQVKIRCNSCSLKKEYWN